MPSFSQQENYQCDACGREFAAHIWLIIDLSVNPDLGLAIANSILHNLICPFCRQIVGTVDVPLLVYMSSQSGLILFSPAENATIDESRQHLEALLHIVRSSDTATQGAIEPEHVQTVRRSALRELLKPSSEATTRLRAPEYAESPPDTLALLDRYITAPSAGAAHALLALNPDLITRQSVRYIARLRQHAEGIGDPAATHLQEREEFIARLVDLPEDSHVVFFELARQGIFYPDKADFDRLIAKKPYLADQMGVALDLSRGVPVAQPELRRLRYRARAAYDDYKAESAVEALLRSCEHWRELIDHPAFTDAPATFRGPALANAGLALLQYAQKSDDANELNLAIDFFTRALASLAPSDDMRKPCLANLAVGLLLRFQNNGDEDDAVQAVVAADQAVREERNASKIPAFAEQREMILRHLFENDISLSPDAVKACLPSLQRAVDMARPGASTQAKLVLAQGNAYGRIFDITGNMDALDGAIAACRKSLDLWPRGQSITWPLGELCRRLELRYRRTHLESDLNQALEAARRLSRQVPLAELAYPLFRLLSSQHRVSRTREPLDELIAHAERLINSREQRNDDRAGAWIMVGNAYTQRNALMGDPADIDSAIEAFRLANVALPERSQMAETAANQLGLALFERSQQQGRREDIEESIVHFERALSLLPAEAVNHSRTRIYLGDAIYRRFFMHTGDSADLERAISIYESIDADALAADGDRTLDRQLAMALRDRHRLVGRIEDLERAIKLLEQAALEHTADDPEIASVLTLLGGCLRDRFSRTGSLRDRDMAIDVQSRSVGPTFADPRNRPGHLNNYANSLLERFAMEGDEEDLTHALAALREALALLPSSATQRPAILTSFGRALSNLYKLHPTPELFAETHQVMSEALQLSPADVPEYPSRLSNLGSFLLKYVEREGDDAALDEAISLLEQAVTASDGQQFNRPSYLNNAGAALRERYIRSGNQSDLARAAEMLEASCQVGLLYDPATTIASATNLGRWALERTDWELAVRAYGYGVQAVDRLYETQLLADDRELWLRQAFGLNPHAAYALARVGRYADAIVMLEQGRARELNRVLARDRADFEALAQSHPTLVAAYQEVVAEIRFLEKQVRDETRRSELSVSQVVGRMEVAQVRLDKIIARIGAIPGYESFLTPARALDIGAAILPGEPLVYIATCRVGGLALVVSTGDKGHDLTINAIWLDALSDEAVLELLFKPKGEHRPAWSDIIQNVRSQVAQDSLDFVLEQLWESCMGPVVNHLAARELKKATLLPIGLLGLLPLHAASDPAASPRRYACDTVTFRYAPSGRVLIQLQRKTKREATRLMVVHSPLPSNQRELPFARYESQAVAVHFAAVERLEEQEATRQATLDRLADAHIVHIACHGSADINNGQRSGVLLAHDELLSLQDLFVHSLPEARMAVLSACSTGLQGMGVPDEVVSLPSAFLRAGFAGAIGSLWAIEDKSSAMLMERFYRYWQVDGLDPEEALAKAQWWMRATTNETKLTYYRELITSAKTASDQRGLPPPKVLETFMMPLMLQPPHAHRYEHPLYWAAFTFNGL